MRLFTAYRRENLRPDLVAGISVAAVQIPTAIAYAQLAGFPPLILAGDRRPYFHEVAISTFFFAPLFLAALI